MDTAVEEEEVEEDKGVGTTEAREGKAQERGGRTLGVGDRDAGVIEIFG